MANKQTEIIKNAKDMINSNFYYIYGMKGQLITKAIVDSLIRQYPNNFGTKIRTLALGKVGKGYGIDCSGFVCKAAGIPMMGSSQIYSSAPKKWSVNDLSNLKNGQFIWRSGHVGIIEIDANGRRWILEAQSTASDLKRHSFETRYKSYTHYGEIRDVVYDDLFTKPSKTVTRDSSTDDVKWLQTKLNECLKGVKGFVPLVVDGSYGGKTTSAVLLYWSILKWNQHGRDNGTRAGAATIGALDSGRIK